MNNIKYRVFYKIFGQAKYVSHLSIQKTMIRTLFRAGLKLEYSQGFNPRPRISFALPLPVYCESEYEIMDISLKESLDLDIIKKTLNKALPNGIEVFSVSEPIMKISSFAFVRYRYILETESGIKDIENALKGELWVLQRTKKAERKRNIAPYIYETKVYDSQEFASEKDKSKNILVEMLLGAGENNHVNPGLIEEILLDYATSCDIIRIGIYNNQKELLK